MRPFILSTCLAACIALPLSAQDRPGLEFEAEIDNSLLIVMTADLIRKNCEAIDARKIKAVLYIKGIERRARALGYSKKEIEHHVEDEDQKARLKKIALGYLGSKGLVADDPASYCAVGRSEISAKSTVGRLLKGG
ncbi:MAG: hypothetical protein GKR99_11325 [Rhodobacteraceae bacterium]|nr:hypothetical protein [Paracoccaceae bacterium]